MQDILQTSLELEKNLILDFIMQFKKIQQVELLMELLLPKSLQRVRKY
jgi:hypothetical protein